jgi:hypothetical protein
MGLTMRLHATLRWSAITALVLAAAGPATAQSPGTTPPAAGTNAQLGFERKQQLSPQDELSQADQIIAHMDQSSGTVRRQLEQARAARDVVKTLCLNDKLSQIDVATRSARDRQAALQAAVQRNDAELADHQYTVLTEHQRRAEQLTAEANQCIGEEVAFVGQTQVTVQIEPNLPQGDTTTVDPTQNPMPVYTPPPCQSCTGGS